MTYAFDTIIDRGNTDSEKYDGLKKYAPVAPTGSVPLWIADMDFKTSPEIIQAMHRRVEEGVFGYTDIYNNSYYEIVCKWMENRHGWKIEPQHIIVDSGVVPAILHGLTLMAKPGDGVIIHTPSYKPFYDSIHKAGMNPVFSKLQKRQGQYEIDFEDLEIKARDERNKVLLLCSPHNPTGRVWTKNELMRIMAICKAHGLSVISDEIHCDILRHGVCFTPLAKLFPSEKQIITCTSPSKAFNLAGNHLANIIIPDSALRERWNKQFHYLPNPISLEATKAAYKSGGDWLDALNRYIEETFEMINTYFHENLPKVDFYIPEATYLAWINMGGYGLKHDTMVKLFVENGLIIEGGEEFVENGSDYIRMNVASPHSVIKTVLEKTNYIFEGGSIYEQK